MKLYKLWFYFSAFIKKILLWLIYRRKLRIGAHTTWRRRFNVMISEEGRIIIGDNCFFNNDCSLNANRLIEIGNGSIFGENVKIYDHNHRFRNRECSIKEQGFSNGEVYIGNHCWIGSNVVILKGTHIEDNCVIGAGCVISGKVSDGTVIRQCCEYHMEAVR